MAKKVYVEEPKVSIENDLDPTNLLAIYPVIEWTEGQLAIVHPPGSNDAARVELIWGEGIAEIRQKAIAAILAFFPDVSSNDIIFLGGWN